MTSLTFLLFVYGLLESASAIRLQEPARKAVDGGKPVQDDPSVGWSDATVGANPMERSSWESPNWPLDSPLYEGAMRPGYVGKPADEKMAAAFGGGGCYSVLSQIGYLRGLLTDDIGVPGGSVKLTVLSSSSGGSWSVGKFFENAPPGGLIDAYMRTGIPFFKGGHIKKKNTSTAYLENDLGRHCMVPLLSSGTRKSEWSIEMMGCASCLGRQGGSCEKWHDLDPIFGVASACLTGRELSRPESQDWMPPYPAPLQKSNGKDYAMPSMHHLRLVDRFLPQNRSKKLKDLSDVFRHETFGETQWSIAWGGVSPMGVFAIGSSGSAARSDYNMAEAMFMSGDAPGVIHTLTQLMNEILDPIKCPQYLLQVREQTKMGGYPWPFAPFVNAFQYLQPPDLGRYFMNKGVDGGLTDTNAVGEALRLLQEISPESRPKSLTALVVGRLDGQDPYDRSYANVEQVLHYFQPMVPWQVLFASDSISATKLGITDSSCGVFKEKVKNTNYFFDYRHTGAGFRANCTIPVMLSSKIDQYCANFAFQAMTTGTVFARHVTVVKNPFWGIKGGWTLTAYFSLLSRDVSSEKWKQDVYGEDTVSFVKLQDFPFPKLDATGGTFFEPFHAFALMNYNAYKGYMSRCALTHFHSNGTRNCVFCQQNPDDCKTWLPLNAAFFRS